MTSPGKESTLKKAEDNMVNEGGPTPDHAAELAHLSSRETNNPISSKNDKNSIPATKPLQDWIKKYKTLVRTFKFKTFPHVIAFMVEVALFCEKTDHHPEWTNTYDTLHVSLSTHDAGGITNKDHQLAAHMDKVFEKFRPSEH